MQFWRTSLQHLGLPCRATLAAATIALSPPPAPATHAVELELVAAIDVDPHGTAGAVDGLAFSPDGRLLAASDNAATAYLYDLAHLPAVRRLEPTFRHARVEFTGRQQPVGEMNAIAFSPDGRWLATGVDGVGAKVWSVATGELVAHVDDGANCDAAAFSPDGRWLASAADHQLMVRPFITDTGELGPPILVDPHGTTGEVNSVDWTRDGRRLASGGLKLVRIHRLQSVQFTLERSVPNNSPNGSVKSVRFSPDGRLIAFGARDERARVLDAATGATIVDLPHDGNRQPLPEDDNDVNVAIEAVAWSDDGAYLLTSGLVDGVLRLWRRSDWSLAGTAPGQAPQRAIETIDVHSDLAAVGGDEGVVRIFRLPPPNRR